MLGAGLADLRPLSQLCPPPPDPCPRLWAWVALVPLWSDKWGSHTRWAGLGGAFPVTSLSAPRVAPGGALSAGTNPLSRR